MFQKILIANRGDNGRRAVAAKPKRLMRAAHAGEFPAEARHV
jgi:acetyl/propionyl-CoA carboxylase alpha subunit